MIEPATEHMKQMTKEMKDRRDESIRESREWYRDHPEERKK